MEYPAFQGQAGEVFHVDANPVGLFFRQPSRTCCTKEIGFHLQSLSQAAFQLYHHGALTVEPYEILTSGQRWSRPEATASELLYSVQASSLGITPLPEPDTPAPIVSSRFNSLSSLAISEPTAALGLEVTYSVSN